MAGGLGDTVGWGFTMTNGDYWAAIDSVVAENESSPVSGTSGGFTSYMDLRGGMTNGVTAPHQIWSLSFTPGNTGTGVGQYVIDPSTPPGAEDTGDFLIYYDEFSADPNTCGSCYVDTLRMFDSTGNAPSFTIDVEQSGTVIPEPSMARLVVVVCGLAAFRMRRCRQ